MIKNFFKLYGFVLLIIFSFIAFMASTIGLAVAAVILCVVFKTGIWALLLIGLLFTVPFWWCLYEIIKN